MSQQQENLALSERWEKLYNEDADQMVLQCYAEDFVATPMGLDSIRGHDVLRKVEEVILEAAPRRQMRVDHRHVAGDVVIVEAVLLDPDQGADFEIPFVAVLTCKGGKIAIDRTYGDFSRWPGL